MCGICGHIGGNREHRVGAVQLMNSALYHRGPDFNSQFDDDNCSLAMSRLAIIDLKGGDQPKYSSDNNELIFFNGEIYNHLELRKEIPDSKFETVSDTETIIRLFEVYGKSFVNKLRGMFAFCIYNKKDNSYFFARDSFGEKPFFYYHDSEDLIFSSEVKSLLENTKVPRELNKEVLPYYLTVNYVPEPFTLLKGVETLPPGCTMVFKEKEVSIEQYFNREPVSSNGELITDINEAKEEFNRLFSLSVKRQMLSDVPLGAFLSGGIDSSSVVAHMQKLSSTAIKTFNVKFEDSTYDESIIAKEVASKFKTDHHEIVIPNANFTQDIFWDIIDHVGLPFPDSSAIPTFYISKEIKKHVTVALSGDGGDELFGGYNLFDWYTKINKLSNVPNIFGHALHGVLGMLSHFPVLKQKSFIRQFSKAIKLSMYEKEVLPFQIHRLFSSEELGDLGIKVSDYSLMKEPEKKSAMRHIMGFRLKNNLPLDMLIKVDRMSMANSLEVRAPFLDVDLFNFSSKLSDNLLMNKGLGKLVIRESLNGVLPDSVFNHPKRGFSIPLHNYQNKEFKGLVEELLEGDQSPIKELFDSKVLQQIIDTGLSSKKSDATSSIYRKSHQLWALLQLSGWIKRFKVAI